MHQISITPKEARAILISIGEVFDRTNNISLVVVSQSVQLLMERNFMDRRKIDYTLMVSSSFDIEELGTMPRVAMAIIAAELFLDDAEDLVLDILYG